MGTFSALASYEETSKLKTKAVEFARSARPGTAASGLEADSVAATDLATILDANAHQLSIREVQFLPRLCFPLETSRDANGLRFVLWKPVIEFLQAVFEIEIEQWLCHDEVALVYLRNDAADFAHLIYPKIEKDRLRMPFRSAEAAFQVACNSLCEIELTLKKDNKGAAKIAERIHYHLSNRGGISRLQQRPDLIDLAELASRSPAWAVESCAEFLRQVQEDMAEDAIPLNLASEKMLAVDWLTAEEDEAWRNL